jgi:hypothetical protein
VIPETVAFRPAYLAAPFAAKPEFDLSALDNTIRARSLAHFAIEREQIAPVYVHEAVWLGAFGDDNKPEDRERGLLASLAIAEAIAVAGGELWLLELPDGSLSHGVERELRAFVEAAHSAGHVATVRRWHSCAFSENCPGFDLVSTRHMRPNDAPDPVDEFGGVHCAGCATVHGEPDYCPECGRRRRHPGEDEPQAASECPKGAEFAVKIVSCKFEVHAADGSVALHEGPLESLKAIIARRLPE